MNKRLWITACLLIISMGLFSTVTAQEVTTTTTATTIAPSNDVTALYVACADQGVINLSGTSLVGFDVYYQLFSAPNATGTALSTIRQVPVAGVYSVSEALLYTTGQTLAAGATGSARVIVAREGDVTRIDFEFNVNDINDGCATPQFEGATSTDSGAGASATDTDGSSGAGFTTSIFSPTGLLNSNLQAENTVVIGARPSDEYRSDTPGTIFAECDSYPLALPGILYDTDQVVVYWSWFTRTVEQMQDHLANAQYAVRINTATFNNVVRSEIIERSGSVNQWVFYTTVLGNLSPGHYEVSYELTWTNPVFDGYDDYGPSTANSRLVGLCNFDILLNPDGVFIAHNGSFIPTEYPVHNINPDY